MRGAELWAQATGQGEFRLFASAPLRFFARVTPMIVTFKDGSPAPSLSLEQNGRTLIFARE